MQKIKYLKDHYLLIFIFLCLGFIFSINIHKPFVGHHDFNSAFFSIIANNLTKNAVAQTKLGQIQNSGKQAINNPVYYTHNVPLFTWILAVTFLFFGNTETNARLVSILFSLGSVFILYLITKLIFSKLVSIISILFYSLSAIVIYFSSIVFPEPIAIFFSLLSFYFYMHWLKNNDHKKYLYMLFFSTISLLIVWGSYFLPPFIVLHYILTQKNKEYKKILIFAALPFVVFFFFLMHLYVLTGSLSGGGLVNAFLFRTNQEANPLYNFTLINYLFREIHLLNAFYSKITILLVFFWFVYCMVLFLNKKYSYNQSFLLVLFAWGASYPLLFSNASYIHDYFLIYLAPFIAISAAFIVTKICFLIFSNKLNYQLITIIIFMFPLLQFFQTKNFTYALIQTNSNKDGMILGKFLKANTASSDNIIILSDQFGAHFGVFTNYYSERNISYRNVNYDDLVKDIINSNYNYAVSVYGRETDVNIEDYLNHNHLRKDHDIYKLYKLN